MKNNNKKKRCSYAARAGDGRTAPVVGNNGVDPAELADFTLGSELLGRHGLGDAVCVLIHHLEMLVLLGIQSLLFLASGLVVRQSLQLLHEVPLDLKVSYADYVLAHTVVG